jgi:hypothetical protein
MGFFTLHGHEPHRQTLGGPADRLSIGRIALLSFGERLDMGGRDQAHLMAQLPDLAIPQVGAPACFHGDDAGLQLTKKARTLSRLSFLRRTARPEMSAPCT